MAVTTAKAGHFSARIVPAIWVVAATAAIIFFPLKAISLAVVILISVVAMGELTRMVIATDNQPRNGRRVRWPWAIEWALLVMFPIALYVVGKQGGEAALAWLVGVLFVSDVGAFYGGKALSRLTGGHKLAERISPGKTWEGVFTGLLGAALWTSIMLPFRFGISPGVLYCLALSLAIVGMAGDLLESWLKRQADVKDSSLLLREHGGMLDRLDGLLAAAPVAVIILWVLIPS